MSQKSEPKPNDVQQAQDLVKKYISIKSEIAKKIVGQQRIIDELVISLLCKGHCLIVGVPGLAKTMIVHTLADVLDLKFNRIQFTPDLMPSDITGTEIIEEDVVSKKRNYRFIEGPVFANIVLADEINRTPPKTQSALLQAMQENKVTVNGITYNLPQPFFVLATQNPIEQEGTYPLPEAQLDRFFFQVNIDYPSVEEEKEILNRTTGILEQLPKKVLTKDEIVSLQNFVRSVPISDNVIEYIIKLVRWTRPQESIVPEFVKKYVLWGCSPRAEQTLVLASKVQALISERYAVSIEDVNKIIFPALRHRLILNYQAESEGLKPDDIIKKLITEVENR